MNKAAVEYLCLLFYIPPWVISVELALRFQSKCSSTILKFFIILGSPSSDVSCTVAGDPSTPENVEQPLDNTQNEVKHQTTKQR